MNDTKQCMSCKEVKPFNRFYRGPFGKPQSYCQECTKKQSRERYRKVKGAPVLIRANTPVSDGVTA